MMDRSQTKQAVAELVGKIKDSSPEVRTKAWLGAGGVGAAGVGALAEVMTDKDLEVARAAKRALWQIVRHAGRPGADDEKDAVAGRLVGLLGDEQVAVRREALWMLSEIGEKKAVTSMADLLADEELREDARQALERIPGKKSVAALKAAFKEAPEEFKPNLAQSLRKRGVKVRGYECVKLVPTKKTIIKPLPVK
jgi:HEAT repeat protein